MASRRRYCKKPSCRRQFTPARGTRRVYCYECHPDTTGTGPVSVGERPAVEPGAIELSVRAELERAERLGSVAGQVALRLARDLDGTALTGSQAAGLSDRLLKVMEAATAGAPAAPDEIDHFQAQLTLIRESA